MQKTRGVSILNPDVLAAAETYRPQFESAAPFPHVVIDNFFEQGFAEALFKSFPAFDRGNAMGDDGHVGGKSTLAKIRQVSPAYKNLDDAIKSQEFLSAIAELTGIKDLIYDPWYLGGGTHENRDGMSLDPHVDFNFHPSERWHRRLNLIVYLNPEWGASWGGNLELFHDPQSDVRPTQSLAPSFNRGVIFETSERSWHAFDQIRLPLDQSHLTRRSIALYFYTKDRPAEEIAARHTTYYVKRQLPVEIDEGRTLSRDDVNAIKQLLDQRDSHIRMLYAENTALREAQDAGLTGNLLYLAKRAFVRLRR